MLNFLQTDHAALNRGEILSLVTRALLISVWFADLFVGETQVTDCCFGVYLGAAPSTSMLRHRAKAISTSASLQLAVSGAVLFENSYGLQEGAREGFWPMAACRADVL